ncbi:MBL fold metallo-hydrolase [Petroclostridium sp. X23]|uniref:MBL fold metallo-hydrolase RNA specificity domain-containing protein n=1 Tax=Petroclostridium sp. X23 TaxID=3045146 RepID=UPI0024ADFBF2|nr:MBL fold metallo-hydrolase [Petroclostridium sp. X23]WHH59497.1 MBL fold metallo-hydrolase [Petroclostridium sp. X23]
MNITFLGAAKTVTGSCYYLEVNDKKLLIDCGMFQGHDGDRDLNFEPFPFDTSELDYVLLTHAHIDHSGRIPKLYKDGFRNKIIATKATVELCEIMLPDSGHIQETEYEWINRKRLRAGKKPIDPLYTYQDAVDCIECFEKVKYDEYVRLPGNITVRFSDAGHILGSSILEIWVNENGQEIKLVFSGDLGNRNIPILRDPTIIESADYLFIESTYGNRLHKKSDEKISDFVNIIIETIEKGGNVVIPSFAVGRTQEVIYELHKQLSRYDEKIKKLFNIPVYVDSPLAISATEVFRNNLDCYDEEAREYIKNGDNPLDFPTLQFTKTAQESKELNEKDEKMIVISASGMCEAGRIKHHLKHNLWRPESTILFVGYQAQGTLGRRILEGAKKVRIFGEEISIHARIESIESFSGHADQKGLLDWLSGFSGKPKKIFIVHGEEEAQKVLSDKIKDQFNIECIIPDKHEKYSITENRALTARTIEYDKKYRYTRLQLLEYIQMIQEEMFDLEDSVREAVSQDTDDETIEIMVFKLKELEKSLHYFKRV